MARMDLARDRRGREGRKLGQTVEGIPKLLLPQLQTASLDKRSLSMPINANGITALPARRTNSRCRFHETVHPRLSANLGRRGGVGKTKRGKSLKGINLLSQEKKEEKKLHPRKRLSPLSPSFLSPLARGGKKGYSSLFSRLLNRERRERA